MWYTIIAYLYDTVPLLNSDNVSVNEKLLKLVVSWGRLPFGHQRTNLNGDE